jgi:hypothetical protein
VSDGYGGLPSAPQWDERYATRPARADPRHAPPPVQLAFRLMLARCVLSLASIVVALGTRSQVERQALRRTPTVSHSTVDIAIDFGLAFSVVILVLYALLAVQVRRGANWARVVTWVFAGFGVLGMLVGLTGTSATASRVLVVIQGLIDIALIILLAQRPSSDWFRAGLRRS